MVSWLKALTDMFAPPSEEEQKHAEEERRKAEEATDDGESAREEVDPANPANKPASRDQDVNDEVHRALQRARGEAEMDDSSHSAKQDASVEELGGKFVRGETDTGIAAASLHEQAQIQADLRRLALLNSGVSPQQGAEVDDVAEDLHPNVVESPAHRQQRGKDWRSYPADFLKKHPVNDEEK